MKNYWLTRKAIREEIEEFKIPEIPPINFPAFDFPVPVPPLDINIPPIVFGPCIDITGMNYEIPTEIKLTAADIPPIIVIDGIPPVINLTGIDWSKCAQPMCLDGGLPPSQIVVDWGVPPTIDCIVTVCCPGTTPEEYAAFCEKQNNEFFTNKKPSSK